MTAAAEPRVRHRRRVTGRRALIAGAPALGITGAAIVTTTPLSPAGAATARPSATGSRAVSEIAAGADGTIRKFSSSAITYT